jgi:hypothetical protein
MTQTPNAAPPPPDSSLYMKSMIQIRERLDTVMWLFASVNFLKHEAFFSTELIFLQFRKLLELLAFASLTVNKELYAKAHANFETHWRAKRMLEDLKKVNPDFYPWPLMVAGSAKEMSEKGRFHYELLKDGFLTPDEFVELYDASSQVIHTPNPFSRKAPSIDVKYPVPIWVERIRSLLRIHSVGLPDGRRWIVYVPDVGNVSVHTAKSDPNVK